MQALRERISSKLSDKSKKEKDGSSSLKYSASADGKHTTLSESQHHQGSLSSSAISSHAASANVQSAERGTAAFPCTSRERDSYARPRDPPCYFVCVCDIYISSVRLSPLSPSDPHAQHQRERLKVRSIRNHHRHVSACCNTCVSSYEYSDFVLQLSRTSKPAQQGVVYTPKSIMSVPCSSCVCERLLTCINKLSLSNGQSACRNSSTQTVFNARRVREEKRYY